tara:strand:- start:616 stop:795 length:180 start_codon:yes stop_codon:yes gene_type:complete
MPEIPSAQIAIVDFPGLQLERDELSLQDGGSHEQVNAQSNDLGSLTSRLGYLNVSFEDD